MIWRCRTGEKKLFCSSFKLLSHKICPNTAENNSFHLPFFVPDLTVKSWATPNPEGNTGKVLLHMAPQSVLCLSLEYTNGF